MNQSTDIDLNLHHQCGQEKLQAENLLYGGFKLIVDQVTSQGNSNPSGKKSMSVQANNDSKCHELQKMLKCGGGGRMCPRVNGII